MQDISWYGFEGTCKTLAFCNFLILTLVCVELYASLFNEVLIIVTKMIDI